MYKNGIKYKDIASKVGVKLNSCQNIVNLYQKTG